jgi:hypothetical protein
LFVNTILNINCLSKIPELRHIFQGLASHLYIVILAMRRENKELHNLYASPNSYGDQMKKDEWAGDVARMGEIRNCLQNYGRET